MNNKKTIKDTSLKNKPLKGSCLCGQVQYEICGPSKLFRYCFCSRCQKITGAAHATFIYSKAGYLNWVKGEDLVQRFDLPDTQYYANCFCKNCGSNLPWQVQQGDTLIIPAGSLDTPVDIEPTQAIYWQSRAAWYKTDYCKTDWHNDSCEFERFDTVPKRAKK